MTKSKHKSIDVVVRQQPFVLPEQEELGALGVTQQLKGAHFLGSPSVVLLFEKLAGARASEPLHGRRGAPYSPSAQLVRVRKSSTTGTGEEDTAGAGEKYSTTDAVA